MYRTIKASTCIIGRPSSLIIRRNAFVRYQKSTGSPLKKTSKISSSTPAKASQTSSTIAAKSSTKPVEQPPVPETNNTIEKTKSTSNDNTDVFKLHDAPLNQGPSPVNSNHVDWSDSFHGLGSQPFSREIIDILLSPIDPQDIEIKPDGLLYLPEIKYRRILNRAFGPGGWGMAPRSESMVLPGQISREYALVCHGRLVSIARGEQDYFGGQEKVTTALEGCKSNALMRCCKDLGIASELWDPGFIRKFKQQYCDEIFAEHVTTKKKKKLWKLKSIKTLDYPYKIV